MNWFEFNFNSFLFAFVVLNIVNVILQTVKSLVTIKGTKTSAATVNAIAYGLYVVVVVYMNTDGLGLFWKGVITGAVNFLGVFIVKWFEEKIRKDKLWKVEATVYEPYTESLHEDLKKASLPHSYIENVGKYTVFNIYCETQADSLKAKEILYRNKAKYFVSENKGL
jgi:uncharacterized protein YebE (UPF0316 family)